jgi:hypothetical protein
MAHHWLVVNKTPQEISQGAALIHYLQKTHTVSKMKNSKHPISALFLESGAP